MLHLRLIRLGEAPCEVDVPRDVAVVGRLAECDAGCRGWARESAGGDGDSARAPAFHPPRSVKYTPPPPTSTNNRGTSPIRNVGVTSRSSTASVGSRGST